MTSTVAEHEILAELNELTSVAVIGMGYVGLPTALGLHESGVGIIGIDLSQNRLDAIRSGEVDLIEADHRRLEKAVHQEDFQLTADLARMTEADAVLVCVPTGLDEYLMPDLGPLESACTALIAHARVGQTLILTSTSYVGTAGRLLVKPLVAKGFKVGRDIFVASSPERIDPGNVTHTQQETPRVLGGVTPACTAMAQRVINLLTPAVHCVSSAEVAELTKLYENTFRAVNIALANEFAEISDGFSIDPIEVIDAAASKPYGFMAFHPGPGVGGHCIPCDPHYLLWQLRATQHNAPLVTQAMHAIAERPKQVVDRIANTLSRNGKGLAGTRVLVVGVTYKPGVQDVRSSSALDIIDLLAAKGAKVGYHDPLVSTIRVTGGQLDSVVEPDGDDWDVALIHTVQPGHGYDWLGQCPLVIDATYRFDPALFAN
ncbi:nucleotide sugar dehydrogenase [Amycolatopsis sp. NBRC 101858]|uniref:nucleotide sugar dehydrogenase n=1 Tax=Amycolatopsis sp. NBRC 101858 TaxID=3032200 RepID=UPI0024A09CEC|nr:nucleotide sugar dehydrogenase [Amycolatopsis sp. NBRC 101858]GLY44367.1 nucleotide sugar dehydrogenase [Amycolatopsis sp. NBRC 101858]